MKLLRRLEVVQPIHDHPLTVNEKHIRHGFHTEGYPQRWIQIEIDEDQFHLVEKLGDVWVMERDFLQLYTRYAPLGLEIDHERLIGLTCPVERVAEKLRCIIRNRRFDKLHLLRLG